MARNLLITGLTGSYHVDELTAQKYILKVFNNPVHVSGNKPPSYLNKEIISGVVKNSNALEKALNKKLEQASLKGLTVKQLE